MTRSPEGRSPWGARAIAGLCALLAAPALSTTSVAAQVPHAELRVPGYLFDAGPDRTLMTDLVTRRWFFVEGTEVRATWSAHFPLPDRFGQDLGGMDRNGPVLGVEGFVFSSTPVPVRLFADSLHLLLATPSVSGDQTLSVDTISALGGRGRLGMKTWRDPPYVASFDSPLATEDQGWLFPDGWIAVAYGDPYRVDWREPSGAWRRGSALPRSRIETTLEEKCFGAAMRGFGLDGCDEAYLDRFPGFPTTLPAFPPQALLAGPEGNLVIARTPSAGAPEWRRYDFVDRRGSLVRTLTIPISERIVGFGRESVYVVERDELWLERLRRHPWP